MGKEKMKTMSLILTGIGITLLVISVFADSIGIGGYPGFGRNQSIGTAIGAVILIIGIALSRKEQTISGKRVMMKGQKRTIDSIS